MSFTSEIRDFSRARLRTTVTNVTRLDGSKWVETRPSDQHAFVVCRSPGDSCGAEYGYVVDVAPDLQIGWILPNLLLGQSDNTLSVGTGDSAAACIASRNACDGPITNRVSDFSPSQSHTLSSQVIFTVVVHTLHSSLSVV